MSKKNDPKKEEEVEESKMCMDCKHREKPTGKMSQRGWCSNPKSPHVDGYIYKGDTCDEFVPIVTERKGKGKKKDSDD